MAKFTFEEHQKRIRDILNKKPKTNNRSSIVQALVERAQKNKSVS